MAGTEWTDAKEKLNGYSVGFLLGDLDFTLRTNEKPSGIPS